MPEWIDYDDALRSLNPARVLINTTCNLLELNQVIRNNSLNLYQLLIARKLTVGRKREALVGACVYITCNGVNYPVKLNELCKSLEVSKRDLIRQVKFIKQHVETNDQGVSIQSYISRYGYELGLSPKEITKANEQIRKVERKLMNHKPTIQAVVCLYLAHKEQCSIRQLSRITGLSRSGIYEAYKKVKGKSL